MDNYNSTKLLDPKQHNVKTKSRLVLALLFVALPFTFYFYFSETRYCSQSVLERHYEAPTVETLQLESEAAVNELIALRRVPKHDHNYHLAQFSLGHLYLEDQNYSAAQIAFLNASTSKDEVIIQQSEWYLGLAKLGSNNGMSSDLNELLTTIKGNEGHLFQSNAIDLTKEMSSFWRKFNP